jgi:hypothetical protein
MNFIQILFIGSAYVWWFAGLAGLAVLVRFTPLMDYATLQGLGWLFNLWWLYSVVVGCLLVFRWLMSNLSM